MLLRGHVRTWLDVRLLIATSAMAFAMFLDVTAPVELGPHGRFRPNISASPDAGSPILPQ
jgi:hypothetical protein